MYFQQQLFQFFPVLPASSTSREAECCCQAFSAIPCIRKGESSEDGTSVLFALGSVIAELFAVPEVLHTLTVPSGFGQGVLKEKWVDIRE